jgi:hypothetical protein
MEDVFREGNDLKQMHKIPGRAFEEDDKVEDGGKIWRKNQAFLMS